MPSSHLILCHPLLLLPPIPPGIRVFSNESTLLMRWPKYWSFSFSIIPSKEHPGLISFRMDWLDLLAVQGTLKSLLQHHSSKASILWQIFPNSMCVESCTMNLYNPAERVILANIMNMLFVCVFHHWMFIFPKACTCRCFGYVYFPRQWLKTCYSKLTIEVFPSEKDSTWSLRTTLKLVVAASFNFFHSLKKYLLSGFCEVDNVKHNSEQHRNRAFSFGVYTFSFTSH